MRNEQRLYAPIAQWLRRLLTARHPRSTVVVRDSHRTALGQVIRGLGLVERFPQSELWELKVDVVGVVVSPRRAEVAIVECKVGQPNLMHVCQLLGYSLVVKPAVSLLISPKPISDSLAQLLRVHGRYDILQYDKARRLRIARWVEGRNDIDHTSLIPPGEHF